MVALFRVEDGRPANRAEAEFERGAVIADADIFSGGTEDFERGGKTRQCGEDAAGPLLAGEAVAKANASWLAFHLNA